MKRLGLLQVFLAMALVLSLSGLVCAEEPQIRVFPDEGTIRSVQKLDDNLIGIVGETSKDVRGFFAVIDISSGSLPPVDSIALIPYNQGYTSSYHAIYPADFDQAGNCTAVIVVGEKKTESSSSVAIMRKMQLDGSKIWEKEFGESDCWNFFHNITPTSSGWAAVGYTTQSESSGIYVVSTDPKGDPLTGWPRAYGGSEFDKGYDIAEINGDIYPTGLLGSWGQWGQNLYAARLDSQGNALWQLPDPNNILSETGLNIGRAVIASDDGMLIFAGKFGDMIGFVKVDQNGNVQAGWPKIWFDECREREPMGAELDNSGDITAVGYIGNPDSGDADGLLWIIDQEGRFRYCYSVDADNNDQGTDGFYSVASTSVGIILAGITREAHLADMYPLLVLYKPDKYNLTVNTVGDGTISVGYDRNSYYDGEVVQLTANHSSGWQFSHWTGNLTGSANPADITMDAGKTVTAVFTDISTSSGGSSGGSGCFIATAAFGSILEPEVQVLREFRDELLLTNCVGRIFVDTYYTYSPPAADFIAGHDSIRAVVRWALLPVVGASWIALRFGGAAVAALLLIISSAVYLQKRWC